MAAHDLWYKNAILYCLDVEKYMDANGDGTGDFEGLHRRLEYLAGRRRLAPMLKNDRRRLELAFSLLFSLPGTPMMQYGDEIGMGDDLTMEERECARTPMQWTNEPRGGFSKAERTVRPVISDETYGYEKGQRRAAASRSRIAAELDGAADPHAQGMSRARVG
ncbi:MAG TPA: hypothetical protein VGL09_00135 [Methylomirabilota bacterium]|jgi:glycosidase